MGCVWEQDAEENITKEEVTGGWKILHNEELHNLYSLENVIKMK
jgi:hypothetical protein